VRNTTAGHGLLINMGGSVQSAEKR